MTQRAHDRTASVYPVALAVALVVVLGASFFAAQEAPSVSNSGPSQSNSSDGSPGQTGQVGASYDDNGLNCRLPGYAASASYPDMRYLVPRVVHTQAFLRATNGTPYVYSGGDKHGAGWINVGGKIVSSPLQNFSIVGGNTTITPPGMQIYFRSYGPGTSCEGNNLNAPTSEIWVDVPIENGAYNMTGMSVHQVPAWTGAPRLGG
jgi:hypothetical protein